ncbi:MAG: VOC family protein [Terracidiphilus sp.]|jgi:catechol 2,3-dioxygenase-like lactoylglutathione lyase family enzyme
MMFRSLALLCALMAPGLAIGQQPKLTRPPITGISHVTLYADDLNKSQQFYGSLLGWEQTPTGPAHSGVRFYANHGQYIELVSPSTPGLDDRLVRIAFSTSDAGSLRSLLAANGVAVPPSISVDEQGNKFFQMNDPEGHAIEFTQQGPHAPEESISAHPVSTHINHAGFVVRDRAASDHFYRDILGFHLYWQGGSGPGHTDWVMMQVPDGTDWLEYMLYLPASPSRAQLDSANHFSPGVVSIADLQQKLKQNGWVGTGSEHPLLGVDAKWQFDLADPDGTRVEFMEFKPVKEPCCSPYTGTQPSPSQTW